MQYWNDRHMDDGWGAVMMLGMLGIWVLVAVVIVWAIRSSRTPYAAPPAPPPVEPAALTATGVTASAERILAERLARGEIDPEEYGTRLSALTRKA